MGIKERTEIVIKKADQPYMRLAIMLGMVANAKAHFRQASDLHQRHGPYYVGDEIDARKDAEQAKGEEQMRAAYDIFVELVRGAGEMKCKTCGGSGEIDNGYRLCVNEKYGDNTIPHRETKNE